MNRKTLCLFGGALAGAGLAGPAVADTAFDGVIVQSESIFGYDLGVFAYSYGPNTIDTFNFTVTADSQVQLDILSWQINDTWIDAELFLFVNDGNPLGSGNYIAGNDDADGPDLNGSLSPTDSFLDIFLAAGEYTVAVGTFPSDIPDVAAGTNLGLVWSIGGIGLPTEGQYHLDIFGESIGSGDQPCNPADIAAPFGVLDLNDVQAFVSAFIAGDTLADLAEPFGVLDLADLQAFVGAFIAGCG